MNTNSDLIGKMIYIPGGTHPRSIARNNMSKVLAIHLSSLQKWLWHRLMGYKVKDFEIGMHVVNMQDWQKVKNWGIANGYDLPEGLVGGEKVRRNPTGIDIDYRFQPGDSEAAMYPVTAVGWYDCVKWCNAKSEMNGLAPVYLIQEKIYRTSRAEYNYSDIIHSNSAASGYRLPTEAEWEWAARGGKSSQGFTFSGSNYLDVVGWFDENSGGKVHPVGLKAPNELGIYDMSGNVWEWCWDGYKGMHRLRGGSWYDGKSSCAITSHEIGFKLFDCCVGFRIARSL